MKLKNNQEQEKQGFKPFELTLEVESIQEARLLFHVFNHEKLKEIIFSDTEYAGGGYSNDVSRCIDDYNLTILNFIQDKIDEAGEVL